MALTVNYGEDGLADAVPTYLFDQAETYYSDPRAAALEWFSTAFLGLSVFYGLPALTIDHEDTVRTVPELETLKKHFTAEHFDAMELIQLTIAAGARYLRFPACYDDGFCLFNSSQTDFSCAGAPAQRDLVAEIASVCEYHGIGLFLEYSLGANAHRYPDGLTGKDAAEYTDFVHNQIHELITGYGTIAGICFGGLGRLREKLPDFDVSDLYQMIRSLQPNSLVSFEDGRNGTEDFFTVGNALPEKPEGFLAANKTRPVEVRQALSPMGRSYNPESSGRHLKTADLWKKLADMHRSDANLLVNTALMPDGSLDVEDIDTLLELGKKLEKTGRP